MQGLSARQDSAILYAVFWHSKLAGGKGGMTNQTHLVLLLEAANDAVHRVLKVHHAHRIL